MAGKSKWRQFDLGLLQMSNPFSPFNVYLGIVYGLYWWIYPQPFPPSPLAERAGLAVSAGSLMYAFTNASFLNDFIGPKIKVVPAFESPTVGGFKGLVCMLLSFFLLALLKGLAFANPGSGE